MMEKTKAKAFRLPVKSQTPLLSFGREEIMIRPMSLAQ